MEGNTDECWTRFKKLLLELEDEYIPKRTVSTKRLAKKPIWMTRKAVSSVTRKKKSFHKYKDPNHPAVKAACKSAKAEIRKSRLNFEQKLALNIKNDTKSFFAYARSKTKCKVQVGPLMNSEGVMLDSSDDMVQSFNDYFASVFTTEDVSSLPEPVCMTSEALDECGDIVFTEQDVFDALSRLREDKAAGADDLSPRYLLQISHNISYPLYLLFRKSLDTGRVVPDEWKCANISPVFKKGCRNAESNYRPVSLTSQVCKLFESIVRDGIVRHLENNMLIYDSQHGFRKRHSCLTNLLTFLDKVSGCLDSGENIDVVFLDFAKAFDKVPHKRLEKKLKSHGITGKLLKWITEWLHNRKQRVCVNGSKSGWQLVLSGVPQGSVLGPILFLIYINDLDCGISNWILKFADDTKIFGITNDIYQQLKLQEDLNTLFQWSSEWQMLFNIDKCKVMHLGRHNALQKYTLNNQALATVSHEKDLGVVISEDLKASQQCSQAYSKASKMLGLLNRTIIYKSQEILLRLYKSLVRPHLEYCTAAWSPHYKKDKELLERIQRRFTRMIPELKRSPYPDRLKALHLWTLEERRIRADLIEVFKMLNGLSGIPFESMFTLDTSKRTRGHSYKILKSRFNTDLRQHFFSERVINFWNSLDDSTVSATSLNIFKQRLKQQRHLLQMGLP